MRDDRIKAEFVLINASIKSILTILVNKGITTNEEYIESEVEILNEMISKTDEITEIHIDEREKIKDNLKEKLMILQKALSKK